MTVFRKKFKTKNKQGINVQNYRNNLKTFEINSNLYSQPKQTFAAYFKQGQHATQADFKIL